MIPKGCRVSIITPFIETAKLAIVVSVDLDGS